MHLCLIRKKHWQLKKSYRVLTNLVLPLNIVEQSCKPKSPSSEGAYKQQICHIVGEQPSSEEGYEHVNSPCVG